MIKTIREYREKEEAETINRKMNSREVIGVATRGRQVTAHVDKYPKHHLQKEYFSNILIGVPAIG